MAHHRQAYPSEDNDDTQRRIRLLSQQAPQGLQIIVRKLDILPIKAFMNICLEVDSVATRTSCCAINCPGVPDLG
jgi:hypothetical protein